jgi:hypothetical protein
MFMMALGFVFIEAVYQMQPHSQDQTNNLIKTFNIKHKENTLIEENAALKALFVVDVHNDKGELKFYRKGREFMKTENRLLRCLVWTKIKFA